MSALLQRPATVQPDRISTASAPACSGRAAPYQRAHLQLRIRRTAQHNLHVCAAGQDSDNHSNGAQRHRTDGVTESPWDSLQERLKAGFNLPDQKQSSNGSTSQRAVSREEQSEERDAQQPVRAQDGNGAATTSGLSAPRGLEALESIDAFELWLDAADAIFPKQLAKSPLPPVAPVPGVRRHRAVHMLGAAPSCAMEIPKEPEEAEVWECVRREARENGQSEPMLSSFINAAICSQPSFTSAVAFVLAHRLAGINEEDEMTAMFTMFQDSLAGVRNSTLADLVAVRTRDEACTSMAMALLYHGGFHSLQLQRVAHALWMAGEVSAAVRIQSLTSRAFGADLHPAARFGKGVYLAHPLGIVVGEAAVVGDHVTMMQHVTLGGTGNEPGDRHPKIGDFVQIGVKATILGNIRVGSRARVAAGSMVLKPVEEDMLVAGNPAKVIGKLVDVAHQQGVL